LDSGLIKADELDFHSRCAVFVPSLSLELATRLASTKKVSAIIARVASLADHAAGFANAHGIQLVVAPELTQLPEHSFILIDGRNERLAVASSPDPLRAVLNSLDADSDAQRVVDSKASTSVAVMVDGSRYSELHTGLVHGATGVGILRSEWVGWSEPTVPTLEMLFRHYEEAVVGIRPHRVNIRLFDIGGDKIPHWAESHAASLLSPLGFRGVRASGYFPKAFEAQFRAIAKCADIAPVGVVVPMVTDVTDILEVKHLLDRFATSSQLRNIAIGTMIEVPSAALTIDALINEVEFVRIGPGDLSQFTLGKLRSNLSPREFSGGVLHRGVLDLIQHVSGVCSDAGKELTICLDVEPRAPLIEALLARNVRRFTAAPLAIEMVCTRIAQVLASGTGDAKTVTKGGAGPHP